MEIQYLCFDDEFSNVYCFTENGVTYVNLNYTGTDKTIILS